MWMTNLGIIFLTIFRKINKEYSEPIAQYT